MEYADHAEASRPVLTAALPATTTSTSLMTSLNMTSLTDSDGKAHEVSVVRV